MHLSLSEGQSQKKTLHKRHATPSCSWTRLIGPFKMKLTNLTGPVSESYISSTISVPCISHERLSEVEGSWNGVCCSFVGIARLMCSYHHYGNIMNNAYRCSLLTATDPSRMIVMYPWLFVFGNTRARTVSLLCPHQKCLSWWRAFRFNTHTPTSDESNFLISD